MDKEKILKMVQKEHPEYEDEFHWELFSSSLLQSLMVGDVLILVVLLLNRFMGFFPGLLERSYSFDDLIHFGVILVALTFLGGTVLSVIRSKAYRKYEIYFWMAFLVWMVVSSFLALGGF